MIAVRPPKEFTLKQIDDIVESKRIWIYKNLAEWKDLNASTVVREWVNGESFLYLGRTYRLSLIKEQEEELKLKEGRFCLNRGLIEAEGEEAAKKAFINFYIEKGMKRLAERVSYFAPKVGVQTGNVVVKELGYRWATCAKDGNIHFHWKCMMAPPKIIDYIVVHELCHLHYRNHTNAFWNEVDKILPDYNERKEWLRIHGANLDV